MAKLSSYLRGSTTTTGINTSSNLVINSGSATGTASQNLQVIGGAYVSSNTGIGTTNPQAPLHVVGTGATTLFVNGNARITGILSIGQGTLTIDGDGGTVTGLSTITGSTNYSKPNLAGISSTISSTAVDVFVYDTRKDSDGGQWRKRTQHTSWYNETLNTATRGSRRDFPAVAVIVATTSSVTIYDGDDPDMPMWMVFNRGVDANPTMWWDGNNSNVATSVIALNGLMMLTTSSAGSYGADFIGERWIYFYNQQTNSGYRNNGGGLVNRNSAVSSRTVTQQFNGYAPSANANDVAMTVLPNAPIDSATGLPVPTIAVATDAGVSVIKDDGNVWDIYASNDIYDKTRYVRLDGEYLYYSAYNTQVVYTPLKVSSINSDLNFSDYNGTTAGSFTRSFFPTMDHGGFSYSTYPVRILGTNGTLGVQLAKGAFATAETGYAPSAYGIRPGLTFFDENLISPQSSMVAYATTSYNTGWMHGDIKGAWLSDTSTASVTGSNLVTNGDFASGTTGWTAGTGATLSVTSGVLRVTNTATNGRAISNTFATVVGQRYILTADGVTKTTTNYYMEVRGPEQSATWSSGTGSLYFTAVGTTTYVELYAIGSGVTYSEYDNVSVRIAEADRSVNNKGLAVYGTITKSAVATGSNLVDYSGFSNNTNFLRQPYNSGLDFGTGNFSTICWFKMSDISQTGFIFDRANVSSEGNRMSLYTENSYLKFYTYEGTASEEQCILTGLSNTWINVVAIRNSSGVMELYLNGQLKSSTSRVIRNVTNTTASTTIGARYTGATNSFPGSISLLRISASIPSPTQIAKIYNDEKALFQPNSQCTLYGTSDAVTALAYDDTTKLLSVGTSSGRSDFQGLERINNTTTAVTTAISASNGLIAEQ